MSLSCARLDRLSLRRLSLASGEPSRLFARAIAVVALTATVVSSQTFPSSRSSRPAPLPLGQLDNSPGFDMGPETTPAVVQNAVDAIPIKLPDGPFQPTWDSLKASYVAPEWFAQARFGLFMHWGLYSVPAHHSEWYEKHMYSTDLAWHTEHFGPPDQFGYKDFIPRFTAEKFDPKAWAELFRKSGAKYVIPTAEHHENFPLWDSAVAPINARNTGPKRDLIGELSAACRAEGLKFGVSNHGIENFQFINPSPELFSDLKTRQADLFDPKWAGFYHVADRSDAACTAFLVDWAKRNVELIDKYQPDILWFDNGVDHRTFDPLKLWIAAYYYNRAAQWNKPVSLSTKKAAMAPGGDNRANIGSILDFERIGSRSPSEIRGGVWEVDDPIGSTWGYTSDMTVSSAATIVTKLVDTVSRNGNYTLNLSPRADGTIPDEQQQTLLEVGRWLETNGDAIYGTHAWTTVGGNSIGRDRARDKPVIRYTVKDQTLNAIVIGAKPNDKLTLMENLPDRQKGSISSVRLLGGSGDLPFTQDDAGVALTVPQDATDRLGFVLQIRGLTMNSSLTTRSGNPE